MLTRRGVIAAGMAALGGTARAADADLPGVWRGTLMAGALSLRLRIEVAPGGAGVLTSVDQAGVQVPGATEIIAGRVRMTFPAANGRFEGRFAAPDRLEGAWTGSRGDTPLVLVRGGTDPAPPATVLAPALTEGGLAALRKSQGLVALAAAAQRGGGPVRLWADGERRLGGGVPVTVKDQWHLGSVSKSMLATVAGRLVDQRRVAWDDSLGAVLGKAFPQMHPAYRDATLLHLLSHRAGLPDNLPVTAMRPFAASADAPAEQRAAYLRIGLATPPSTPPGAAMIYSNVGYVAAAAMLSARTGQSWDDLMRAELFAPLKLASAGFGPPGAGQPVGHGAFFGAPFQPHPPGEPNADLPAVMAPAGAVHMALTDLLTYLRAHRDRTGLLNPATWARLHTPPFGGAYALGWVVDPAGVLSHNGSNQLWYAEVRIDPARGLIAAAASNDGRAAQAQAGVGAGLAGAIAAVA